MKQFNTYSIYVSGNTLTEKEIEDEISRRINDYYQMLKSNPKFRAEIEKAKKENGFTDSYAEKLVREDGFDWTLNKHNPIDDEYRFLEVMRHDSSPKARHYENIITGQLERINTTEIGKLFFETFNREKQLWITLLESSEQKECDCFATTEHAPVKDYVQSKYPMPVVDKGEDILFHEVVHAYRKANGLEMFYFYKQDGEYLYSEEFAATLFQNIYRSCVGEQKFIRYSKTKKMLVLSKIDFYKFLGSNADIFRMLKEMLLKDSLAQKISKLAYPFFNPLRDYEDIKNLFHTKILKKYSGRARIL